MAAFHTGEAQLDVLGRRKRIQEAAALVQLGGARDGERPMNARLGGPGACQSPRLSPDPTDGGDWEGPAGRILL